MSIEIQQAGASSPESEERYRAVAEAATDAIIAIDSVSTILIVNPATERIFGYSTAEIIGKCVAPIIAQGVERKRTLGTNFENSSAVIHVKDLDGRFLLVTRKFEEVVGLQSQQILGKTPFDLFPLKVSAYKLHGLRDQPGQVERDTAGTLKEDQR